MQVSVEEKYLEFATLILGKERAKRLAEGIWNLEKIMSMRKLKPLLANNSS